MINTFPPVKFVNILRPCLPGGGSRIPGFSVAECIGIEIGVVAPWCL